MRQVKKFLAVETTNPLLATTLGGYRRDTSRVIRAGSSHYGFVIDVYPDEKREVEGGRVLGVFDTVAGAYDCLETWAKYGSVCP